MWMMHPKILVLAALVCAGLLWTAPRAIAIAAGTTSAPAATQPTRAADGKALRVGIIVLRSLDDPKVILADAKKYPDRDFVNDEVNRWFCEFPRKVGARD